MQQVIDADEQRTLDEVADVGDRLPDSLETSPAECTLDEVAERVADLATQLHGGNGHAEEHDPERLHRDAHGWSLAGGAPSAQRVRIASELLGRSFDQHR